MSKTVQIKEVTLYFLPLVMRMPLKFGNQTLTGGTCARARVVVEDGAGRRASGWGETPLSVGWVWPANVDYANREEALIDFTRRLAQELEKPTQPGHPVELGRHFCEERLESLREDFNSRRAPGEEMPHLASLVCYSLFDIAVHDAYGQLHGLPTYQTYGPEFLSSDLASFLEPARPDLSFAGQFLSDYLIPDASAPRTLPVWHLVGGLDPLEADDLTGNEPKDGYPVLLRDWIRADALDCLKVKLRGNDQAWDLARLLKIGTICREEKVTWLTADFNCTVTEPAYVNEILDQLKTDDPVTYQKILYVEQPFPYDLEANRIDVRSVSARKPLFMDESAHDWKFVKMGRELGWTGVALKTCKTQTGALLSAAWAKAHGMTLMVQDLTNPMLAAIPHFLLASHAGTIMGLESNGMQFFPEASAPERAVHPGLYKRRQGRLDASTLGGGGFGYRVSEINRQLPEPAYGKE